MKTKFSSILQIKKQECDKLQNEIIKLQNRKKNLQKEILELKDALNQIEPPSSGSVVALTKTFYERTLQKENIDLKEQNILFIEEQVKLTELKYKEAMLEYEKIKHLHEIEEKNKIEEIKRLEAKELDEIGTLLFTKKSEK